MGRWDFDNGTGKDISGNSNDAVLGGGTIYSLGDGRACIRFMPDADPMRIPASEDSPLAISRGTICFWLNTVTGRNALVKYDNKAVEINAYRGDLQARFGGEDDFKIGAAIAGNMKLQAISVGSRAHFDDMNAALALHQIKPVVDQTFAFEELSDALRAMATGSHFGKICLKF